MIPADRRNGNVHAQVTAQLNFDNKQTNRRAVSPTAMQPGSRCVPVRLSESDQVGSPYPAAYRCRPQRPPRVSGPIATPPANQANGQTAANRNTTTTGPRNTQRNETSNYELDRTIMHTKKKRRRCPASVGGRGGQLSQSAGRKPLPLTSDRMSRSTIDPAKRLLLHHPWRHPGRG
ncbi:flagellar M-ring protein FliF C-terminal domain-containing protein [Shigella flexneri]